MAPGTVHDTLNLLEPLIRDLSPSRVLTSEDPSYRLHSEPYAIQKQSNPHVVLVPDSVEVLAKIVRFLYDSDIDLAIRGHGFKSASAKHVLVSMLGFKGFTYDSTKKIATVGAGATCAEVVDNMESVDPGYSVVAARTPSIGVVGTILNGGLSWMSTEYGCVCDPENFLDAEVVKYDGTVVMASQEPDLLWALRGGGGGFGIVTKVLLRAHPYPEDIWSGIVLVPRKWLPQLIKDMGEFNEREQHPKVTYFMYLCPKRLLPAVLEEDEPNAGDSVLFHLYDALGEEHGRLTFAWALDKAGTIDRTRVTNMKGITKMQRTADIFRGTMKFLYAPMGLPVVGEDIITRAVQWYESLGSIDKSIQENSTFVFEFLIVNPPKGGYAQSAWPRTDKFKHLLLLIASCPKDGPESQEELLREITAKAPAEILLDRAGEAAVNPAGLEPYHDAAKVYGENYSTLVELRKRYDPRRRFQAYY
ncbi:hypothetical protein Daus18300_008221 [Diaporthe australafricana]|uniref:FAD-binding PCMH-type domain-containing protein n=1 Tax=Diaporthe australafricana TaxID=127596 RepID=A0ABR3WJA4_9PEZI